MKTKPDRKPRPLGHTRKQVWKEKPRPCDRCVFFTQCEQADIACLHFTQWVDGAALTPAAWARQPVAGYFKMLSMSTEGGHTAWSAMRAASLAARKEAQAKLEISK